MDDEYFDKRAESPFLHPTKGEIVKALRQVARDAEAATKKRCAMAVCKQCAEGMIPQFVPMYSSTREWAHRSNSVLSLCGAAAIRALPAEVEG